MSKSRLFQFAKNAGIAGGLGGVTYLSAMAHQKRYEAFQKEHPDAIVRQDFQYVPLVGGFYKFSVDEKTTIQKNCEPKCSR